MKDWILFLFVHLLVPILGIVVYMRLVYKMKKEEIPNAPSLELFFVFGTYGVLLILILTSFMWRWSGMASLGAFAAMSLGPLITGITSYTTYKNLKLSKYHKMTYWLSISYLGLVLLILLSAVLNQVLS